MDKLVIRFTRVLDRLGVDYVIISGYIAILFGRSRNTEDVDLFISQMPPEKFTALWNALEAEGFECIITSDPQNAYNDYLQDKLALRFAVKGTLEPNFEVKFPKTDLNRYSLENKVVVEIGRQRLNTSRMELQIAFKLYLGSDKDIEDAVHLWELFKSHLDKKLLRAFAERLKVTGKLQLLGSDYDG